MNYYVVLLRILHIGAGAYWVGSTLLLTMVITPALKETEASGQKFVDFLIKKKRFGTESAGAGGMAGVAGLLLYWRDSGGLTSAWMQSSVGIGFGVGAVLGLIAFIFGVLTDRKLKALWCNSGSNSKIRLLTSKYRNCRCWENNKARIYILAPQRFPWHCGLWPLRAISFSKYCFVAVFDVGEDEKIIHLLNSEQIPTPAPTTWSDLHSKLLCTLNHLFVSVFRSGSDSKLLPSKKAVSLHQLIR